MIAELDFVSNVATALSYYTIAVQIMLLVAHLKLFEDFKPTIFVGEDRQHPNSAGRRNLLIMVSCIVMLFCTFIFQCGTTHAISALEYVFETSDFMMHLKVAMLVLCALVSVTTAVATFRLFPLVADMLNKLELTSEGKVEYLEKYLLEVVEMFHESIVILSSNLHIIRGNSASDLFFGKSYQNTPITSCICSEDVNEFVNIVTNVLYAYSESNRTIEYRILDRKTPGGYIWVESTLCRKNSINDNAMPEINMITRDIDGKKKAALYQEMLEGVKAQDRANEAKLNYISCVAHDLKTPLHSFAFALDLLKGTTLTKEQSDLIQTAAVSIDLMTLTISQTMDISKALSGGSIVPRRTNVVLSSVIKKVNIIIDAYGKQVPIKYCVSKDICDAIITDEEWLWQMLLNLLTNACKYTERGEIHVSIKLSVDTSNDAIREMLLFQVSDTGIGVEPSKIDRLFSAFGQLQEGAATGTGLGLFGLKARVQGLGGSCGAYPNKHSSTGSGTVFWFTIPYIHDDLLMEFEANDNSLDIDSPEHSKRVHFSQSTSDLTNIKESSFMPNSHRPKIDTDSQSSDFSMATSSSDSLVTTPRASLTAEKIKEKNLTAIVVDDVLSIQKLMTKVLLKVGFVTVDCYDNGSKGLDAMKQRQVDIVFSDIQMPIMSGPEMVERFRKFEDEEMANGRRSARQKIIAVTANGADFTKNNSLVNRHAFDRMCPKPLNVTEIQSIVTQYIIDNGL